MKRFTRTEIVFIRKLRVTIPGADQLAVIAAVDTVPDKRTEFFRYRPFEFNGEIGDAAARIHRIRLNDGTRRANGHAGHAAPATFLYRTIYRQRQIYEQFTEEKERSGVAAKDK